MTTQDRQLHLIDIENLLGDDHATASIDRIRAVVVAWLAHVGRRRDDPVVVACNPAIGLRVGLAAPGCQLLVRHGENGADQALLDWAPIDHIATRFSRVVIGSGDHSFAMFARALRERGLRVRACTRRGAMSRSLRIAVESADASSPLDPRQEVRPGRRVTA